MDASGCIFTFSTGCALSVKYSADSLLPSFCKYWEGRERAHNIYAYLTETISTTPSPSVVMARDLGTLQHQKYTKFDECPRY